MAVCDTLSIAPAAGGFGACVRGIDLAATLTPVDADAIRDALAQHGVLSFPGQDLDPGALERLGARLGEFGDDPFVTPMDGHAHVIEVRREAAETAPVFGSHWHSDWSFQACPPGATLLYGAEVPPRGGDTVFADASRAYEALSPTFRRVLDSLEAVHSARASYGPRGLFARDDASRSMRIVVSPDAERSVTHPLVRRHPLSGRRALFVNHVYTIAIAGMHAAESRALLEFLFRHLTRPEFRFRHRWQPRTLLMWDNRSVVHYAEGGYEGHRRVMYRTTLAGEQPSL